MTTEKTDVTPPRFKQYLTKAEKDEVARLGGAQEFVGRVIRPFMFFVGDNPAPLRTMSFGEELVFFDRTDFLENFILNRIDPVSPPVLEGDYVVLRFFRTIIDGCYQDFHAGNRVSLTREEAVRLLRSRIVRCLDPQGFQL